MLPAAPAAHRAPRLCTRNARLLADPTRFRQISERIPAGRWGEPRDFAGPIVFLASDASQYVSGELVVVDGVGALPPHAMSSRADDSAICLSRSFFCLARSWNLRF